MSLANVISRSERDKESWRYTNVSAILTRITERQKHLKAVEMDVGVETPRFVFVDGVWQALQSQLSDLPINILQGNAKKGYRLVLAGQTCLITSPIELLFLTTVQAGEAHTKITIELGANGRLTLIERHEAPLNTSPQIVDCDIILAEQSKLVHGKIIHGVSDGAHFAHTKVFVAEGAYYDNFVLIKGGKLVRNEIDVTLSKMAQCTLNGAMLLRGHEHADTTTRIIHSAPHGTSREMYKTVVAEQARGVFQGKIIVAKDAQKTDSGQLSRALLLSDQAEMDAKPELEIYADDVKCSHGSTVGDLDDQAMFYLRSRGLNEAEVRAMLIKAFLGEIIDEIHMPEWREACRIEVEAWLNETH